MKNKVTAFFLIGFFAMVSTCLSQSARQEAGQKKTTPIPKAIDFSRLFDQEKMDREEFETLKRQKQAELQERLTRVEALEHAVDPESYIVGPGDVFSFNIWDLDVQYPINVSPEGRLLIPTLEEFDVDGLLLAEVKALVLEKAEQSYEIGKVSLSLEALRFFRVHVVGEVEYPGTYIAQAVNRVSDLLTEAGGVTERAWKRKIELRRQDGSVSYFDLSAFEQQGDLSGDVYLNGGDIIFVPTIGVGDDLVSVEGDIEHSGAYRIDQGEGLLTFLDRIRILKRTSDLSRIVVIRSHSDDGQSNGELSYVKPFTGANPRPFILQGGDRIVFPSNVVYVKGAVQTPGAFPYALSLTAKDYAGMAGGDFRSGTVRSVKVYHASTGKTERGPDVLVEAGDVVHVHTTWSQRLDVYLRLIPTITSLILAAHAAGFFSN